MFKEANTGTFRYDFKAKTVGGTYKMGADAGNWKGTFSPGKDQICIKVDRQPENCFFMFRDGDSVFEVNTKSRKVASRTTMN